MRLGQFKGRLNEILSYWEEIEGSIKRAELLQGRVTIPAINELRYAGRQIVRAVSLHDEDGFEAEFQRALVVADQYLVNADHDVVDAVIAFIGRRVNELNARYGRDAIISRVEDYGKLCELVEISMSLIRNARRDPRLRNDNYTKIKNELFESILSLNDAVVKSDAMMALELAAYENKILTSTKSARQAYILSGLLFVALVASLLVRFL